MSVPFPRALAPEVVFSPAVAPPFPRSSREGGHSQLQTQRDFDRREQGVEPTTAGRELFAGSKGQREALVRCWLGRVGPTERKQLLTSVRKLMIYTKVTV